MLLTVTAATIGLVASVQPAYAKSLCGTVITASVTLTSDLSCTSSTRVAITIGANGITLNCAGHVIKYTGSGETSGIFLKKRSHVIVENCVVENFRVDGILLDHSSDNTITGNTLVGDGNCGCGVGPSGINLYVSSFNTVTGNVASSNYNQGFIVVSGSSNFFGADIAVSNVLYGFIDLTSGSGTAGTANTYTSNICVDSTNNGGGAPSSPVGLC